MSQQNVETLKRVIEAYNRREIEASIDEVRDFDDTVLALGQLRARFRSGVSLDTEIGWVVRFRDGLGVWGRAYQSHAEALEAVGLKE